VGPETDVKIVKFMMKKERFKIIAAVYLLFVKDGKILMLRRANTGYEDGNYSLVAGHADGNEALTAATAREAMEEAGVEIAREDLHLKVVMHCIGDREQLDFFFEPTKWRGEIKNMEPDKCDDLSWFSLDELPSNTIPHIREGIRCYREGVGYMERGFI
jgi:8-oxo-dGTP pyrophosphatase MutT (NUDIX family)